ncbi:MAG TPA: HNH endonuclease signature motif containing protein [Nitrosopumilaceae archaeon]|nr:HNH endonuclease signature motif containing protein [Nitrosopumilaceae archaeon]
MNKKQRNFWYPKIVAKQGGEFCLGCGLIKEKTSDQILLIDHKDNIKNHNIIENLQLLCRTCNRIKNPSKIVQYERPMTPEMIKNVRGEAKFRHWLVNKILENHSILLVEAKFGGAEVCGLGPDTIAKYIGKVVSNEGWYTIDQDNNGEEIIVFKGDERSLEEELEQSRVNYNSHHI